MQDRINQFVRDASRLSDELDKISRRDHPDVRAAALKAGTQGYEELLERHGSLTLPPADAAHIQIILDGIRARLRFLR